MKCPPLDIPELVATALEARELVIFPGAGVSMGQPTGLPSFPGLAFEIADKLGLEPPAAMREPDRYLARLKKEGHNVHDACRSIIRAAPGPNEMHRLLLRLFRRPEDVRIVTSNFDPQFSKAALQLGLNVPVAIAPSIPLGDDFRGIVHLHGSTEDSSAERMVLTADDFGQAYMSRGWARQFLLDLYKRYTVLFVGYSHSDLPLQYLAFGLRGTGGKPRFALDHRPPEDWNEYGIESIRYTLQSPDAAGGEHANLMAGLRSWVEEVERTPLQIEARIDKVLHASSDPTAEEEDFIQRSLKDSSSAGHFVRYARDTGLRWIDWLDTKGELRKLLVLEPSNSDFASAAVARWVGLQLAHSDSGKGLSLISRHGGKIGSIVWEAITSEIARSEDGLVGSEEGLKWVAVILAQDARLRGSFPVNRLLRTATKSKQWAAAILLFDALVDPIGRLIEDPFVSPHRRSDVEVAIEGDIQTLLYAWQEAIVPALSHLDSDLAALLEAKIDKAHRIALLAGNADSFRSRALYTRQNIEHDPHAVFARGANALLNLFAAALASLSRSRAGSVEDWADRLLRSQNPILLRFGLYVLRLCSKLSAAEKLSWLFDRSLLYPNAYGGTREVFEILAAAYGELTLAERTLLWAKLDEARPPSTDEGPEANIRREDIDRVCWHLAIRNATDPSAANAKARVEERNPRLAEREPWLPGEFMRDVAGPPGECSPRSVADLLVLPPRNHIDFILEFKGSHWPEASREGLMGALAAAAKENKGWGAGLMRALAERGAWASDVWSSLFWSIRYSDLAPDDQSWFVADAMPDISRQKDNANSLARFLVHGQTVEELRGLDAGELLVRLRASVYIWNATREGMTVEETDPQKEDWLSTAINRGSGWIAEFWLIHQQLVIERQTEGEPEWPPEIRPSLDQIVSGEMPADLLALSVMVSHLPFVRRGARRWTRDRLYRCFDFEAFGDKAWVVWTTLVTCGSWTRDIALELKPVMQASFHRLIKGPDEIAKKFIHQVAAIAASEVFDVHTEGWLSAFLHLLNSDQRGTWVTALAREAERMASEDRSKLWDAWVRDFWGNRLNGGASQIGSSEAEAYLDLAVAFKEKFEETVALLVRCPIPAIEHFIPMEFSESNLADVYPESYMKALNWLMSGISGYFAIPQPLAGLLKRLPRRRAMLPAWTAYCERLSILNVPNARNLQSEGEAWFID